MEIKPRDLKYCGVNIDHIKSAHPQIDYRNVVHLLDFITERYKIHLKKDVYQQEAPWTTNPILREFKFTNVRREHDRQTRYLIKNISQNSELSLREKILNTVMCRAWNNFDTFHDLGGPWTEEELSDPELKERVRPLYHRLLKKDPKRMWWSSAYIQGGCKMAWKSPGLKLREGEFMDTSNKFGDAEKDIPLRPFHIGVWMSQLDIVDRVLSAKTQEDVFNTIKELRGFSDFLAYQVFVDLTYIEDFPFSENEFTVAGPGCKKGLNYIFLDRDGMTYEECIFWIRDNAEKLFKKCKAKGLTELKWQPEVLFCDLPIQDRQLNVMSLENCFCELSKYIRAVTQTGRPRNKYIGGK